LIWIPHQDDSLHVGEIECEQDRVQIIHRQHRRLVDDHGLLIAVRRVAFEQRALSRSVVALSGVQELGNGHGGT
jgi:hypothetical protein